MNVSRRQALQLLGVTAGFGVAGALGLGNGSPLRAATSSSKSRDLELAYLSASEQLKLFRQKKLSPVEVLQAQLRLTDQRRELINCFTFLHPEQALEQARVSERRWMQGSPRALEGITVSLKDENARKGWIVTAGSKLFKDRVMTSDDAVVVKLLGAGAVLHAQTTVPEMYFLGVTWSDLWGVTRNPWNPQYAVGGSSGGSGAALASGLTTLAMGSDMGGSIRIPAAFNGLWGLKPPYARVPGDSSYAPLLPSGLGPLARTLPDMIHLENVISGPAPGVINSLRPKLELPLSYPAVKGMRIAYSPDQGWARISTNVRRNTEAALEVLRRQGAVVKQVDLQLGVNGDEIRVVLLEALLSGAMGADMADLLAGRDQLTSYGRHFADLASKGMGPEQARHAAQVAAKLYDAVDSQVFQRGYQALIMPTISTSEVPADLDPFRDKLLVDGVEVNPMTGWVLTPLWNLLNWNPVLAAPTGLDPSNMPTGIQIAAPTYEDATCIRVGMALAKGMPQLYTGTRFPTLQDS
jgi:Asp-tRNA(Asn)/Glu-tRNA(Gln) amidotransferase A subunit family amidase